MIVCFMFVHEKRFYLYLPGYLLLIVLNVLLITLVVLVILVNPGSWKGFLIYTGYVRLEPGVMVHCWALSFFCHFPRFLSFCCHFLSFSSICHFCHFLSCCRTLVICLSFCRTLVIFCHSAQPLLFFVIFANSLSCCCKL